MNTRSKPAARTLVSSALLMSVSGVLATGVGTESAFAELSEIPLVAAVHDGANLYSTMSGIHTFGATENFYAPASAYFITVSSGALGGDDYYIDIDWLPFDKSYFLGVGINYLYLSLDLKPTGGDPITDIALFDLFGAPISELDAGGFGIFSFDGFSLTMSLSIQTVVDGGEFTRLEFSQLPAPGAFALLGLAGLVGSRRRRE